MITLKTNVPKILHWVWFNFADPSEESEPPAHRIPFQESWIKQHSDWEVKVWKDAEARRLMEQHYKSFLELYDSYPSPIFRADMIRYFILYHFGGLYVDWDFYCFRNTEKLFDGDSQFYAFHEPPEHAAGTAVNNGLMAAVKGSDFIWSVIEALRPAPGNSFFDVLDTTGPGFLSPIANSDKRASIGSYDLVMPHSAFSRHKMQASAAYRESIFRETNCYALHVWDGSWGGVLDRGMNRPRFNRRRLRLD